MMMHRAPVGYLNRELHYGPPKLCVTPLDDKTDLIPATAHLFVDGCEAEFGSGFDS